MVCQYQPMSHVVVPFKYCSCDPVQGAAHPAQQMTKNYLFTNFTFGWLLSMSSLKSYKCEKVNELYSYPVCQLYAEYLLYKSIDYGTAQLAVWTIAELGQVPYQSLNWTWIAYPFNTGEDEHFKSHVGYLFVDNLSLRCFF